MKAHLSTVTDEKLVFSGQLCTAVTESVKKHEELFPSYDADVRVWNLVRPVVGQYIYELEAFLNQIGTQLADQCFGLRGGILR